MTEKYAFAALMAASTAGCALFVVLYTAWYSWWRSEVGWHLTCFVAGLGLMDALFAASALAPGPWMRWALWAVFVPEPIIVWWRISLLVRVHRRDRRSMS